MHYKRPESVLVLVFTAQRDVLLLNRVRPAGFWQSVTGSLEDDERPIDAALRELEEETGIADVSVCDCQWENRFEIKAPWRGRYAPGVTHNTEHVFSCELVQKPDFITLAAAEHTEYRWFSLQDAIAKVSSITNRAALKRFIGLSTESCGRIR